MIKGLLVVHTGHGKGEIAAALGMALLTIEQLGQLWWFCFKNYCKSIYKLHDKKHNAA